MPDGGEVSAGTPASEAIARLLTQHGPRLYALASRLCRHKEDAADLVQDVFLQAFRKWHTFKGDAAPGTWLYTIAARSCKARTRRKGGVDRRVPSFSQLLPFAERTNLDVPSGGEQPVEVAVRREATRAVQQAIVNLPEHFRLPLVLKEMLELSVEDVAEALNVKPETVKTRLHRARLMLRKALVETAKIPTRRAEQPSYERQVCLDLLKAKLDALDRGQEAGRSPIPPGMVCQRCAAVFAELDLAQHACAALAEGTLPASVRRTIERAIRAA
ncbi:MAG: sigma-70 family RNA polymerase sigma factor [Phycisphaerales bacterium]|jgi:RNA polymerase sigma-70 factor (ECF subfamily)|nr:sigma-70 family RNA polymerase sigma factor [Phycisphaerales bacterium]